MSARPIVTIRRCSDYSDPNLKSLISSLFDPFGGPGTVLRPNDRVLIKPNLLKPALPEQAVTTHPLVIQAVMEICLDYRTRPVIGDSPGFYSLNRVATETGLAAIARKLNVPVIEFKNPVRVPSLHAGRTLKTFKLDRLVVESDSILNVPKLKSHQQLMLTAAVKSLYGCIPGKRKAKYHYQFGEKENLFAEMLVELYQLVNPAFTLVDGIVAMEGNGPARGRPKFVGILAGSKDCIALERVLAEILGLPADRLFILKAARALNAGQTLLEQIDIHGSALDELRIGDFVPADPMPIKFQLTRVLRSVLRNFYYKTIKERKSAQVTVLQ